MNWRWIVVAVASLVILDALVGVAVYSSLSWDFSHTTVLTGWPAVRAYCLVMFPICAVVSGVLIALTWFGVSWAMKGSR